MKKITGIIIFFVILNVFSQSKQNIEVDWTITKKEILIGENISIVFLIDKLKNYKILTEEIKTDSPLILVNYSIDEKSKEKDTFNIIITSFESGFYSNLNIIIPIYNNGEVQNIFISNIDLEVKELLTKEEKEKLKKIDDPEKVELKKEKDIEKFRFYFEGYLFWLLIVIIIAFVMVLIYRFLIKKFLNKSKADIDNKDLRDPYKKFKDNIDSIVVKEEDIEKSVFLLSEYFKLFIKELFEFNAVSETTKELLVSLKAIDVNQEDINIISNYFRDLDIVKFAKGKISLENYEKIKSGFEKVSYKFFKEHYINHNDDNNDKLKKD